MNKETIELVKKMIEDGNLSQEIAEKYCPELKESEDERIRKWLICTLKSLNNSPVQIDGAYEMMLPVLLLGLKSIARRNLSGLLWMNNV